jgi:DNA modification methylase
VTLFVNDQDFQLYVGVELNPEYAELCARRLQQLSLFAGADA